MQNAALALIAVLAGAGVPPPPQAHVTDRAGVISADVRDTLDARLASYEAATGHQVVVWIDRTIGDADLADWSVRAFAAWKLGRAGSDDGVAVFVLVDDRRVDIEVGYGLEDRVPDAVASRIIDETMIPLLRAGDVDGAIRDGADAVLSAVEGGPWRDEARGVELPPAAMWIGGGVIAVALALLLVFRPGTALALLWLVGRGWSGGGGGGIGRGGRSGGGGSRGRW